MSTNTNTLDDSPALVIALGNRFRGDDGVGHTVAEQLRVRQCNCRIVANQDDSMALINAWEKADLTIIIDAAQSGAAPGTIHTLDAGTQPIPHELARCSSHGVGLAEAVELGKVLGLLPERLLVFAVEAEQFEPGTPLSAAVLKSADTVAGLIEKELLSLEHKCAQ